MKQCKVLLFIGLIMSIAIVAISCDTSIEPIVMEGKEYSIYGPLNISETPNYIRVHNNKALLTSDETFPLNVEMTFTNLDNGQYEILEDRVIEFGDLYTHNFKVDMPIEYDTRYLVELSDGEGISSNLTTVTTQNATINVLADSATCGSNFRLQLSEVDLDAGERVDVEVGAKVGNTWLWTTRITHHSYDQKTNTLSYNFSPSNVSTALFGLFDAISCSEFSSQNIRYKFTHIGYMEGEDQVVIDDTTDLTRPSPNQQIVLSKYSEETELRIHPCEFDGNPDSCINVN